MSDSEEEETPAKHVNVVFVGEPNVGKTSLIRRFCYDDFLRSYVATNGADFYNKRLLLPGRKEIVLKMVDVGGSELNGHMLDKYLFKADMIVFIYDITNIDSFEKLCAWIDVIGSLITSPPFAAIIGNKCDLEHQRVVRIDRVMPFVKQNGFYSYTTSAKTGEGVASCIIELLAKHSGIPLTDLQKQQQSVIKAELPSGVIDAPVVKRKVHVQQTKTSVCHIQ